MESMKPILDSLDSVIENIESTLNPPKQAPMDAAPQTESNDAEAPKQGKKKKKEKKAKQPPAPQVAPEIAQFLQCDLRVGRIVEVGSHPEADGLYVLKVSFGGEEVRTVCAGLRKFIPEEEMRDRMVVTICNLKPRKLRGVASEAMILAGSVVSGEGDKETVVPIGPPDGSEEGTVVGADGIEGERTVVDGKFVSGKIWDKVVPRLGVKDGMACYDGKQLRTSLGAVTCALPDGAEIH